MYDSTRKQHEAFIARWLTPEDRETVERRINIGQNPGDRFYKSGDDLLSAVSDVARKVQQFHGPVFGGELPTRWIALILDHLVESDEWSRWAVNGPVGEPRTVEQLREAVEAAIAEQEAERELDPEVNLWDARDQALARAWLGATLYEQWYIIYHALNDVQFAIRDNLFGLCAGTEDGSYVARTAERAFRDAADKWYQEYQTRLAA